ncbi:MAG: hypothetical protein ACOH1Q_01525 [Thiobacillus sp.]|nr:hypothetical protein [Thiobacillus sp.]
MIKNTLLNMVAAALLTGLTFVSGSAMAQTPDGSTPANEGVCNVLQASGVSPGLYGLCVAYCEAQDLDSFDKSPPNAKILANYNKRKQSSDPAMPCVKAPCPCWSNAEMAAITGDGAASACLGGAAKLQLVDNVSPTRFAEADTNVGRETCRYIDQTLTPATVRNLSISPAEAQSCYAAVQSACQSVVLP